MSSNAAFHIAPLRHPAARSYDAEWRRLRRDPAALQRAATWGIVRGELTTLDQVLDAVGYDRPPAADTEERLWRLVGVAAGDALAAQVVMRRLLPGALSVAVRNRFRTPDDSLADVVGALWIAIRTFDAAGRRPRFLAAALLSDAEYRVFRCTRRRALREVPSDTVAEHLPAPVADDDPAAELAELAAIAAARGITGPDDVALLRLLVAEPSTSRLAAHLDVTERTIRNRRARLTAKLRAAALAA